MESGLVFNIQKYSVHDGPGIRTTVFLKGCPLCCAWCHNPEGQSPERELMVVESRCTACGECRQACPFGDSIAQESPLPVDQEECTLCCQCVEACPTGARQVVGRSMTVSEVMAEITQDLIFYDGSQGGVSFSGGEPLLQPQFLKAMLLACRSRGIRTAVDTCGFACTNTLLEIARLTDLVLYDLKLMDKHRHREYTGVSNRPILENLRALDQIHQNIWLRVPVIPGLNDDAANLDAVAHFASSVAGVRQVSLLPYHKNGMQKFRRLSKTYPLDAVEPPSAEQMERAADRFRAVGLPVRVGG